MAGRANFITGELPIRTGMTTVGLAGSTMGIPDQAVFILKWGGIRISTSAAASILYTA
jgi:hypothetical protein